MTNALLYGYLIGWIVTAVGLALTGRHLSRPIVAGVVSGAAWPLLLLGAVQFVAVAMVAEAVRVGAHEPKSIDDELEALLTEWAISDASTQDHHSPVATGSDNAGESDANAPGQSVACR